MRDWMGRRRTTRWALGLGRVGLPYRAALLLLALVCVLAVGRTADAGDLQVRYEDTPVLDDAGNPVLDDRTGRPAIRRVLVLEPIVYFPKPGVTREEMQAFCPVFERASQLLWNATEQQMRFGTVRLTNDASLSGKADFWVRFIDGPANTIGKTSDEGAEANALGWDSLGKNIKIVQEVHVCDGEIVGTPGDTTDLFRRCKGQDTNGALGIVHELGHYLFGLGDEYKSSVIVYCGYPRPETCDCTDSKARLRAQLQLASSFNLLGFCAHNSRVVNRNAAGEIIDGPGVEKSNVAACIMDAGTTVRTGRTEFCNKSTPTHQASHEKTWKTGDGCAVGLVANGQHSRHHLSCWEVIAKSDFVQQHYTRQGFTFNIAPLAPRDTPQPTDPAFFQVCDRERVPPPTNDQPGEVRANDGKPAAPAAGATSFVAGPGRVEVVDGPPAFLLLIDQSGSMGDPLSTTASTASKMDQLKVGARNAIDVLRDGESFAMLSMDDGVSGADLLGMDVVSGAHLESARAAVAALTPKTKTDLWDALDRGRAELDALGDTVSGKIMILISDGRHTVGADELSVLVGIKRETRITIHTVALGPFADRLTLGRLAEQTGGSMFIVDDASKLVSLMPRIFDIARGDVQSFDNAYASLSTGASTLDQSVSSTVDLSEYDETATFLVAFEQNPDYTDDILRDAGEDLEPEKLDFRLELLDPNGNRYRVQGGSNSIVEREEPDGSVFEETGAAGLPVAFDYVANTAQVFLRVRLGDLAEQMRARGNGETVFGTWKLDVVNQGTATKGATVLASNARGRVYADARVVGFTNLRYPKPIRLEVPVIADGAVLGLEGKLDDEGNPIGVTADVYLPGSQPGDAPDIENLFFYDDGRPEHGDAEAQDGIYSALFTDYVAGGSGQGGSGRHRFVVSVRCEEGQGTLRLGEGLGLEEEDRVTDSIAPFTAVSEVQVNVLDVPSGTLPTGGVTLSTAVSGQRTRVAPAALSATTILRFTLQAQDEYARLDALTLTTASTVGDPRAWEWVALYRDDDGDGVADNPLAPLGLGQFVLPDPDNAPDTYELTLTGLDEGQALAVLPDGEPQHFVIGLGPPVPLDTVGAAAAPTGSGAIPTIPPLALLLPALVVFLVLFPAARGNRFAQRVAIVATVTGLFLCVGAVGCGGGGGGTNPNVGVPGPGPGPGPGTGGPFVTLQPVETTLQLWADDLIVRGLSSKQTIDVTAGSQAGVQSSLQVGTP